MDVGERPIMVHHAMHTPNCNTSNTRVFDPFNLPTSGSASACPSSHPWDRRATYLDLLLLFANLPLECVAPTGGYTLVIFGCRARTISLDSVLTVSAAPTHPQRPLRASLTSSVSILMVGDSRNLTEDSRASSVTCLRPWLRPLRLSRMIDNLDHLRRRRRACGRRFNMGD